MKLGVLDDPEKKRHSISNHIVVTPSAPVSSKFAIPGGAGSPSTFFSVPRVQSVYVGKSQHEPEIRLIYRFADGYNNSNKAKMQNYTEGNTEKQSFCYLSDTGRWISKLPFAQNFLPRRQGRADLLVSTVENQASLTADPPLNDCKPEDFPQSKGGNLPNVVPQWEGQTNEYFPRCQGLSTSHLLSNPQVASSFERAARCAQNYKNYQPAYQLSQLVPSQPTASHSINTSAPLKYSGPRTIRSKRSFESPPPSCVSLQSVNPPSLAKVDRSRLLGRLSPPSPSDSNSSSPASVAKEKCKIEFSSTMCPTIKEERDSDTESSSQLCGLSKQFEESSQDKADMSSDLQQTKNLAFDKKTAEKREGKSEAAHRERAPLPHSQIQEAQDRVRRLTDVRGFLHESALHQQAESGQISNATSRRREREGTEKSNKLLQNRRTSRRHEDEARTKRITDGDEMDKITAARSTRKKNFVRITPSLGVNSLQKPFFSGGKKSNSYKEKARLSSGMWAQSVLPAVENSPSNNSKKYSSAFNNFCNMYLGKTYDILPSVRNLTSSVAFPEESSWSTAAVVDPTADFSSGVLPKIIAHDEAKGTEGKSKPSARTSIVELRVTRLRRKQLESAYSEDSSHSREMMQDRRDSEPENESRIKRKKTQKKLRKHSTKFLRQLIVPELDKNDKAYLDRIFNQAEEFAETKFKQKKRPVYGCDCNCKATNTSQEMLIKQEKQKFKALIQKFSDQLVGTDQEEVEFLQRLSYMDIDCHTRNSSMALFQTAMRFLTASELGQISFSRLPLRHCYDHESFSQNRWDINDCPLQPLIQHLESHAFAKAKLEATEVPLKSTFADEATEASNEKIMLPKGLSQIKSFNDELAISLDGFVSPTIKHQDCSTDSLLCANSSSEKPVDENKEKKATETADQVLLSSIDILSHILKEEKELELVINAVKLNEVDHQQRKKRESSDLVKDEQCRKKKHLKPSRISQNEKEEFEKGEPTIKSALQEAKCALSNKAAINSSDARAFNAAIPNDGARQKRTKEFDYFAYVDLTSPVNRCSPSSSTETNVSVSESSRVCVSRSSIGNNTQQHKSNSLRGQGHAGSLSGRNRFQNKRSYELLPLPPLRSKPLSALQGSCVSTKQRKRKEQRRRVMSNVAVNEDEQRRRIIAPVCNLTDSKSCFSTSQPSILGSNLVEIFPKTDGPDLEKLPIPSGKRKKLSSSNTDESESTDSLQGRDVRQQLLVPGAGHFYPFGRRQYSSMEPAQNLSPCSPVISNSAQSVSREYEIRNIEGVGSMYPTFSSQRRCAPFVSRFQPPVLGPYYTNLEIHARRMNKPCKGDIRDPRVQNLVGSMQNT